jgi:hypothetical protein
LAIARALNNSDLHLRGIASETIALDPAALRHHHRNAAVRGADAGHGFRRAGAPSILWLR